VSVQLCHFACALESLDCFLRLVAIMSACTSDLGRLVVTILAIVQSRVFLIMCACLLCNYELTEVIPELMFQVLRINYRTELSKYDEGGRLNYVYS
jgi:hypothetical protein